ncbi:EPS15 homology (EH) [Penicillium concentricum]|uniref:EPS15 homology (EH) n=1 Tax=Penicillium concentricum TaxID=293559 RepID=A0A9W9R9K6_9EURO|nr:EPS15 homology (EH) [Penicillium concentricum]KAJ5356207.1 EPS15 homology (EH) [Penicillium concentricum]
MYGASANQRLSARNDALQGATLAFHSRDPSPAVRSSATTPMADPLRQRAESDLPEAGSVKEKVGRLARPLSPTPSTSSARGRPSAAPLASASQIAARLAASRSPGRDTSAPSTTARPGAGARNASRVPPPQEKRQPPPPIPIRSIQKAQSPGPPLHDNGLRSDSDLAIYRRSSSQQSSTTLDYQDSRESSPHPSLESRNSSLLSDEPKPKPKLPPRVPPPRGSIRNHGIIANPSPSTPSEVSISSPSSASTNIIDDTIGMSEVALSNAIIASSLASARASPAIRGIPPPLPQRRHARSILHLPHAHQPKSDLSRTPSPPKSMPMTLRGTPKISDADRRKHRNPLHKHPHKHKEGDRKRWQREVNEKERKRYEGVWASNKGLLINTEGPGPNENGSWPSDASDMVLNLVVREIWCRSRLPEPILEQVWDLVDHQNIGLLVREEFVVGMWLIDQNLKGHKNPARVRDSVWDSVRHAGIKLPPGKGKGHA